MDLYVSFELFETLKPIFICIPLILMIVLLFVNCAQILTLPDVCCLHYWKDPGSSLCSASSAGLRKGV